MWKATKTRRALFGVLPIIALVLGYQEVFMSQAKANGGIKNIDPGDAVLLLIAGTVKS